MNDIEQVKQKLDIVELIGEFVTLKKAGRNFKGLCPFHSEKSPSFVVSPDRQMWHCFGCSKGGDCITFLMEYEKMEFGEALKTLASRVGVTLSGNFTKTETEQKKEKIYALNALAAQLYHYLLLEHPIGKAARLYLTDIRDIPLGLIKKFYLGFAPSGNLLTRFLREKKKYSTRDLIDAGLVASKNGRTFDFFRDRIIFPIYDIRDNIIAFSARALDATPPKYINTRETLVYKKGDTLFGLQFAKEAIKREGKVVIVEGEFDVISAVHEGIENIVAVKGTALTENQIKVLKRFAQKISFCFDSDPAGTAAQRRSIELIEKEGVSASVIILPSGKDPDELLHTDPVAFKKALKQDIHIYDFILESGSRELDLTSPEGKKTLADRSLPFLTVIDNEVVKEHYLKKLADILSTSYESLLKQGEKLTAQEKPSPFILTQHTHTREELTEEYLLALLFQSQNPYSYYELTDATFSTISFSNPGYNRLLKAFKDFCATQNSFSIQDFVATLPEELLPLFDRVYLAPLPQFSDQDVYKSELTKTTHEVKLLAIKQTLKQLTLEIKQKEKDSPDELERLHAEFNRLTKLMK